jgi:hypothetical protein
LNTWLTILYRILAERQIIEQQQQEAVATKPAMRKAVPNNQPPPPSFLGCLFGWLGPFRSKKDHPSSAVDVTNIREKA